ncbi:6-phosphogluconolactonase [Actinobacillus equuli]|nr:6-phosphogluconolactonase [Actinobacillus equuli]
MAKSAFWWGDDRMVLPTDPESNYGEVQKLLFDHIQIPQQIFTVFVAKNR